MNGLLLNNVTTVLNTNQPQQLDVSALPQGTYLLKEGTGVAKFVKQ